MLHEFPSNCLAQLREHGVILLRGVFALDALVPIQEAARRCFDLVENGTPPHFPDEYRYNPISRSLLLTALEHFGCTRDQQMAPLATPGLQALFAEAMDGSVLCRLDQTWIRKRYAPSHAPWGYQPNHWHQDGGLGVRFPSSPGLEIPMTRLLTCWLPLHRCAGDRPALEFVRRPQNALLHYTELDDATLRRRFAPEDFRAPELEPGDGLLFAAGTLHRTYVLPHMREDRLSVEYRLFP